MTKRCPALFTDFQDVAGGAEAEMTRRGRKEHEADHVGAGIKRGVERLRRGQATYLDSQRHLFSRMFLSENR
jgi:hypothetical protein